MSALPESVFGGAAGPTESATGVTAEAAAAAIPNEVFGLYDVRNQARRNQLQVLKSGVARLKIVCSSCDRDLSEAKMEVFRLGHVRVAIL
jgi:hypothetical protein